MTPLKNNNNPNSYAPLGFQDSFDQFPITETEITPGSPWPSIETSHPSPSFSTIHETPLSYYHYNNTQEPTDDQWRPLALFYQYPQDNTTLNAPAMFYHQQFPITESEIAAGSPWLSIDSSSPATDNNQWPQELSYQSSSIYPPNPSPYHAQSITSLEIPSLDYPPLISCENREEAEKSKKIYKCLSEEKEVKKRKLNNIRSRSYRARKKSKYRNMESEEEKEVERRHGLVQKYEQLHKLKAKLSKKINDYIHEQKSLGTSSNK